MSKSSNLKKRIRKLERGQTGREIKTHDHSASGDAETAGEVHHLLDIAQGDASIEREGLEINLLSAFIRTAMSTDVLQADFGQVRFILFVDHQNLGVLPTVTEVLTSSDIRSHMKRENTHRFRILLDKTVTLYNSAVDYNVGRYWQYYKRFKKPIKVAYIGTAAPVANINRNAVFYLVLGINAANEPNYSSNIRFRFSD